MLQTIIAKAIHNQLSIHDDALSRVTHLQRHLELFGRNKKHRTKNDKKYEEADQATSIDVGGGRERILHQRVFWTYDCAEDNFDSLPSPVCLNSLRASH